MISEMVSNGEIGGVRLEGQVQTCQVKDHVLENQATKDIKVLCTTHTVVTQCRRRK